MTLIYARSLILINLIAQLMAFRRLIGAAKDVVTHLPVRLSVLSFGLDHDLILLH